MRLTRMEWIILPLGCVLFTIYTALPPMRHALARNFKSSHRSDLPWGCGTIYSRRIIVIPLQMKLFKPKPKAIS